MVRLVSRRDFLRLSAAAGAGMAVSQVALDLPAAASPLQAGRSSGPAEAFLQPDSAYFATAFIEYAATYSTASTGDLWPSCWADDGNVYAANGDGSGFSDLPPADIVVNRIMGTPEVGITGERLAAGAQVADIHADPGMYSRKPTGMVAVDGNGDGVDELYLAVQDLRSAPAALAFDDAPSASVSKSQDHGRTWQKAAGPMFTNHIFTTIMFLDFGQSQRHATVLGSDGASYVYAYGLDNNWRTSYANTVPSPTSLYLARVPRATIQDRATWQFYAGAGLLGAPQWSPDITRRVAVLTDERRIYPTMFAGEGPTDLTAISQGSVVYDAPLGRYLYTSWTEYTFEFYEAPAPWGPWSLFMTTDFGGRPWFGSPRTPGSGGCPGPKNGGYACTIPSKFMSADGTHLWVQSNWTIGSACGPTNYDFSLRRLQVAPHQLSLLPNLPDAGNNLARSGSRTTPIEKSAHYGHGAYYNDGVRDQSEDSWDGSPKPLDFWGYTWDRAYLLDRVAYTTGHMFPDGGWFGHGLTVQVRQGSQWVGVQGLVTSPAYPYNATAGPNRTYTLSFDVALADGIRIIGAPGGASSFTSIGELEVYYDGLLHG
jgi:hypothetical protein